MVEYLIFSKYINCTDITDEEFIKLNKNINEVYFGEKVNNFKNHIIIKKNLQR